MEQLCQRTTEVGRKKSDDEVEKREGCGNGFHSDTSLAGKLRSLLCKLIVSGSVPMHGTSGKVFFYYSRTNQSLSEWVW